MKHLDDQVPPHDPRATTDDRDLPAAGRCLPAAGVATPGRLDDDDEEEEDESPGGRGESKDIAAYVDKALLKSRMLMITGPISDALARFVSSRLLVMEAAHPEKPITVFINSPGGSADSGFAIYDMIRFVRPPVRTVVNGLCASAAILVHLAGRKGQRYCLPESRFLIHQPSTYGRGTASDLDITAREIIKLRERYNKIIAQETGQNEQRVLTDAARDFWLNAKEALDYGVVNKVVRGHGDLDSGGPAHESSDLTADLLRRSDEPGNKDCFPGCEPRDATGTGVRLRPRRDADGVVIR